MNSNNKFGQCCDCPAIMSDSRLFTNWETSKTYNYKLAVKLNADTNTKYKKLLLSNPEYVTNDFNKNNITCNYDDKFNKDSSSYHKQFTEKILNEMYEQQTVRPFYSLEHANY